MRYGQRSKIRWRPLLFSKILAAQLPQDRNIVVILSMASQILFYLYFFCWTSNRNVQKWSLPPANEVWGKVMFLHLCVILFMGGAGSAHPPIGRLGGGQTPSQEELPRQTTPQMQSPCPRQTPWMQSPPGRPLMQTPPGRPPWMQTPQMLTHPLSSPITSTSRQYASYWNAFFFICHSLWKYAILWYGCIMELIFKFNWCLINT